MSPRFLSLILVVIGQFLNAGIVLIDKYILTSTAVSRPSSYSFYVGVSSVMAILVLPFGMVYFPDSQTLLLSFACLTCVHVCRYVLCV